jgi:hypothetical protein
LGCAGTLLAHGKVFDTVHHLTHRAIASGNLSSQLSVAQHDIHISSHYTDNGLIESEANQFQPVLTLTGSAAKLLP